MLKKWISNKTNVFPSAKALQLTTRRHHVSAVEVSIHRHHNEWLHHLTMNCLRIYLYLRGLSGQRLGLATITLRKNSWSILDFFLDKTISQTPPILGMSGMNRPPPKSLFYIFIFHATYYYLSSNDLVICLSFVNEIDPISLSQKVEHCFVWLVQLLYTTFIKTKVKFIYQKIT